MTITVGVPFYGRRDLLARCVRSLTTQTYRDLRVLVIADGTSPGLTSFDPRVTVYRLPENRGAYFCRAVALAATTTSHHAVIDSDDWVEPDFFEELMSHGKDAVQLSRFTEEDEHGKILRIKQWKNARVPVSQRFRHYAPHIGVYETQRLLDAGGYSPAYRMGYDTFLSAVLRLQGLVHVSNHAGYHRTIRSDSLSQTEATKIGSEIRERNKARLADSYDDVYRNRTKPDWVSWIIRGMTPEEAWEEVEYHAAQIRGGRTYRQRTTSTRPELSSRSFLKP